MDCVVFCSKHKREKEERERFLCVFVPVSSVFCALFFTHCPFFVLLPHDEKAQKTCTRGKMIKEQGGKEKKKRKEKEGRKKVERNEMRSPGTGAEEPQHHRTQPNTGSTRQARERTQTHTRTSTVIAGAGKAPTNNNNTPAPATPFYSLSLSASPFLSLSLPFTNHETV